MIEVVYSPQWFYGKDILIDIVAVLVLFFIGLFSLRYYTINKKNKNYLHFAVSFFIMSLAFLSKILTYFTIYTHSVQTRTVGSVTLTLQTITSYDTLFFVGLLLYRLLTLVGLYLLYAIYQKHSKSTIFLSIALLALLTYFSQSAYYVFHVTSLILLLLITIQYAKNYKKSKLITAGLIVVSFGIITASHCIAAFIRLTKIFYVAAEFVQLLGFLILLIAFILVLKHGKKKK